VAIIDSAGQNIPDYASIIPAKDFQGVVLASTQYRVDSGPDWTYRKFRHRIRVGLAGRAAEELAFGVEGISNGSREDLKKASGLTGSAFLFWGFAPSMDREGQSESNLLVAGLDDDREPDKLSDPEVAHIQELSRAFLTTEYQFVRTLLTDHRSLLDTIAERLLVDPMLDQEALTALATEVLGAAHEAVAGPCAYVRSDIS
jgi:ATP-dependent Zn protease